MTVRSTATVDAAEARRFAQAASAWWDTAGEFRPLHKLNPARLTYIRDALVRRFGRDAKALKPLKGLEVLDIGCGGGLVCEPLARMGASVTGADVSDETVGTARAHAEAMGLDITYRRATVEDLAAQEQRFDAVLALEVVEHVADVGLFLRSARTLVSDDGAFVFSTLNRTGRAFALAIFGAEYLLRWVPRGTHDWRKFLTPTEMKERLAAAGFGVQDISGLVYDPLGDRWSVGRDTAVNYIGWAAPR